MLKVIRTIQQFLVVKDTNNSIVCVDPPWPLNVTLSARICCERRRTCSYRSIPPAGMALSSKPAALRCCCRSTGQTDGQTVARPLHGQDPAPRTVRSPSINSLHNMSLVVLRKCQSICQQWARSLPISDSHKTAEKIKLSAVCCRHVERMR